MKALRSFLSEEDEASILSAIQEAESRTSGEIRLRIERSAGKDALATAREAFEAMGMRNAKLRNGVLFFLAVEDRTFAILGDDGIDRMVPVGFWTDVKDAVLSRLREGNLAEGLAEGIRRAGRKLAEHFPHEKGDVDELPNAISFADEESGA